MSGNQPIGASGTITAINSTPTAAASSRSAVEIDCVGLSAVGIQITGTYTAAGGLSGQVTVDGNTWVTLGDSGTFTRQTTGVATATVTSAEQDVYKVTVRGAKRFRITALGAVTGTAQISMQGADMGAGEGGGGTGGGTVDSIVAGSGITVDDTDPANPIVSADGSGALAPVTLGAGPTNITHADHSNRAVYSEQSTTTSVVFAVAATSLAEDGDLVTILNLGAGPMVASGANVRLAPGCRAYARENERLVFEYFANDDIYYGGCADVQKAGVTSSWSAVPINNNAVPSITGLGALSSTGSATAVAVAATSAFTHYQRLTWVSAAAINSNCGGLYATPLLWPTAAIRYAWQVRVIFGAHDALTNCQMFCAVVPSAITAGSEPSAKANHFGVIADSTDTNLGISSNNAAGSSTPTTLGANFPANSNGVDMYDVTLAAWSDGTAVYGYYQVSNLISGATPAFGTMTGAELPVDGTALSVTWGRGTEANGTAATVVFCGAFGGFWS